MKNLLLFFLCFVIFSCSKSAMDIEQGIDTEQIEIGAQNIVTTRVGVPRPNLDPTKIYCGPGWGRKACRFLYKYDGTVWTDAENYYSDFSDIRFSNFAGDQYFISFFNLDSVASYCKGWKLGETTYDGLKYNIEIKRDEADVLWFNYDYYGSSEEIEYTIAYRYEVIDGLLHLSIEDQTFIFNPSDKNNLEDFLDTGEIIRLEGCMFY